MCAAACGRSSACLRKAWTIRLHLSRQKDFALPVDTRESAVELIRRSLTPPAIRERHRRLPRLLVAMRRATDVAVVAACPHPIRSFGTAAASAGHSDPGNRPCSHQLGATIRPGGTN